NLQRVIDDIRNYEKSDKSADTFTHQCKWISARDAATTLITLLDPNRAQDRGPTVTSAGTTLTDGGGGRDFRGGRGDRGDRFGGAGTPFADGRRMFMQGLPGATPGARGGRGGPGGAPAFDPNAFSGMGGMGGMPGMDRFSRGMGGLAGATGRKQLSITAD